MVGDPGLGPRRNELSNRVILGWSHDWATRHRAPPMTRVWDPIEAKTQRARSFATLVLFGIAAVVLLAMALAELSSEWQRSNVVQTSQLASSARTTFSDFGVGVEWSPDAMTNPSEGNERPRTLTEVLQESDTYATSTRTPWLRFSKITDAIQNTLDAAYPTVPPVLAPFSPWPSVAPREYNKQALDGLIREINMGGLEFRDRLDRLHGGRRRLV